MLHKNTYLSKEESSRHFTVKMNENHTSYVNNFVPNQKLCFLGFHAVRGQGVHFQSHMMSYFQDL